MKNDNLIYEALKNVRSLANSSVPDEKSNWEESYEFLFKTLFKDLISYTYYLLNIYPSVYSRHEASKDVVMELFERLANGKAFKNADPEIKNAKSWIFGYTKNLARNYGKKEDGRDRIRREKVLPSMTDKYIPNDFSFLDDNLSLYLKKHISLIKNPVHRKILSLELNGLDNKEIAEELNSSNDTDVDANYVRKRKHEALKKLRKTAESDEVLISLFENLR